MKRTTTIRKLKQKKGDFGDKYPGYTWQLKTEEVSDKLELNELIVAFNTNGKTRQTSFRTLSVIKKEAEGDKKDEPKR